MYSQFMMHGQKNIRLQRCMSIYDSSSLHSCWNERYFK